MGEIPSRILEQRLDPSDTVAEAMQDMVDRGVSYVDGLLGVGQCEEIMGGLPISNFDPPTKTTDDFKYATRRWTYSPYAIVPEQIWHVRDGINDQFDEFSKANPEFSDWSRLSGNQRTMLDATIDIVRYPNGVDVLRHRDSPGGDWLSQVILTIQGSGLFLVFDGTSSTVPRYTIPLAPGVGVFLRGSERGDAQMPHAVEHDDGPERVMANFDPTWRDVVDHGGLHSLVPS